MLQTEEKKNINQKLLLIPSSPEQSSGRTRSRSWRCWTAAWCHCWRCPAEPWRTSCRPPRIRQSTPRWLADGRCRSGSPWYLRPFPGSTVAILVTETLRTIDTGAGRDQIFLKGQTKIGEKKGKSGEKGEKEGKSVEKRRKKGRGKNRGRDRNRRKNRWKCQMNYLFTSTSILSVLIRIRSILQPDLQPMNEDTVNVN